MSEFISDRKIKFALVGCGRISNNHFGSFEVLQEDCELVAVCDIDPAALEAAVKRTGVKAMPAIRKCWRNRYRRNRHHRAVWFASRAGGLSVVGSRFPRRYRKPMATCFTDGERMVQAADKAGKSLFVVKQNRLNATLQLLLKRAVTEQRFGKIYIWCI